MYAAAPPTFRYNAVILSFAWHGRVYSRRGTDMQICKRFRRFYPQAHILCRYFLVTNERRLAHCYTASVCYVPIFPGHGRVLSSCASRHPKLCATSGGFTVGATRPNAKRISREPFVNDQRAGYTSSAMRTCEIEMYFARFCRSTGGVYLFGDADVRKRVFAVVVRAYLFGVVLGKHRAAHHYLAVRAIFAQ